MRIIFMGTPFFAVPALEAIKNSEHEICFVVSQPDSPKDRGKKIKAAPVKEKALEMGLAVLQPENIKTDRIFLTNWRSPVRSWWWWRLTERYCRKRSSSCRNPDVSIYMHPCCPDSGERHRYKEQYLPETGVPVSL